MLSVIVCSNIVPLWVSLWYPGNARKKVPSFGHEPGRPEILTKSSLIIRVAPSQVTHTHRHIFIQFKVKLGQDCTALFVDPTSSGPGCGAVSWNAH